MKVILIMVMSVDGKTTKNTDSSIYHWSSKEDQEYFFSLIEKNNLLIMGRNTYEQARPMIQHAPEKLRVILTRTPEEFTHELIPGMLEFSDEAPSKLLARLEKKGYKKALLLGGANINSLFLTAKCIDEVWITIEPYIFGVGKPLVDSQFSPAHLQLLSSKRLNNQGTLLLKYKIIKYP